MCDLLKDNPVRHGIDIEPDDITTNAVRFHKRGPSAHEGIGNTKAVKRVAFVEGFSEGLVDEFREHKSSKQRARPACKPLMNSYRWAVVLLNLFLAKG